MAQLAECEVLEQVNDLLSRIVIDPVTAKDLGVATGRMRSYWDKEGEIQAHVNLSLCDTHLGAPRIRLSVAVRPWGVVNRLGGYRLMVHRGGRAHDTGVVFSKVAGTAVVQRWGSRQSVHFSLRPGT